MCPSNRVKTVCVLVMAVMLSVSHGQDDPGSSRVLAFQAEAAVGYHPRNIHWRSQAAGQQAVWLEEDGDSLEFAICLPRADQVHVTSVRFSSDGWMKEGAVSVDGEEVGTFNTVVNSNFGFSWNTFNTSFDSFQSKSLAEGRHVISVVMKHSMDNDPWGIEIDEVVLEFGSPYTLQDLTCPREEKLASSGAKSDVTSGAVESGTTSATTTLGETTTATTNRQVVITTTTERDIITTTSNENGITATAINDHAITYAFTEDYTTVNAADNDTTTTGATHGNNILTKDAKVTESDTTTATHATNGDVAYVTTTTTSNTPTEERFTFSCPRPGRITVVKNSYYSCHQGSYRFDVFGSDATTYTLNVSHTNAQRPETTVYSGWFNGGQKDNVVSRTQDYVVEAVTQPGLKPMKVTTTQGGRKREVNATRLVLSDLSQGAYLPRVVLDQTSRCYFFTRQDPTKQTSLVLGPRDPDLDSPDSDLDEVELVDEGQGEIRMTMTSVTFGRRSVVFALKSTMTTVFISQGDDAQPLADPVTDPQLTSPLCAVLLPCSNDQLDAEALIRADRTDPVRSTDAWRTITGSAIHFSRPSCDLDC